MAFFPPVAPVVAATKIVPGSRRKHQKNDFQHELITDKEESLKDPYAQNSQRYSISAENTQYRHGGFCSAGLQSKHLTSQACTLSATAVDGQKEGVDRSYPLKSISHHNRVSVPVVNTAQLGSSPYMQETPNSKSSSVSKGKAPAGRSAALYPWRVELKPSTPHLYRRELAYILKLETDGRNLEKAIQKKEALVEEKLRRTQETLRRIQREKELIKVEQRTDSEAERTHEQKAARHPEEKTFRVAVRPGGGVLSGAQSTEAFIPKPGTTHHPQELAVRKLRKKQMVVNNSKMKDSIPMEHLPSCSKLAPKHSPSPSALSDQDSGHHLSAEVLYVQAASAVEQEGLGQCSFCSRKFLCSRLEKHMSTCGKNQVSKRKVFDSSKARARGTEMEYYQQWKSSRSPQSETPPRRNNWRQKHEALIQTVHQARQLQQVLTKGQKVSDLPPLPPMENPDYVACTYCGRQFAPRAAERHIPKCKSIKNRPPPPPQRRRC
ncbi:zinc finger C2HC domain-containing protein 1C [Empidonax traillii]|uniref:zinc finger C2HC domain-containing protein 1C n=1 Tax=Empidonax traillii TaxID=164674 RepID=UPI000FFD155D|nr:zinc finger C2HC domain-containing protein 1C [Empidonax traillii]XP_027736594.1 zinc finger C2HC domain-containing protein 1C [Empidonax traillii]